MTRALCESFVRLRDEADAWCAGRSWAVRLPLLAWFAYILVRHWADADYHMAIPLLSPFGGDVRHDWNYLLGATGLLAWDGTVAFLFRAAASLAMLVGLATGGGLVWRMARARDAMPPAA